MQYSDKEIYRLAQEPLQVNLAVSIGAADDNIRKRLIPLASVYNLRQLLAGIDYYMEKTGRRVSFEYTLVQGVNDRFPHADELAKIVHDRHIHVNLIPFNAVEKLGFKTPSSMEVQTFNKRLMQKKVNTTVRRSEGVRISAACGQLAGSGSSKAKE